MSYSTLQWMAPDLLRSGLLSNNDWLEANCQRAEKVIPNQGLHVAACLFACASRGAIDYLEQAPVLALALSQGSKLARLSDRNMAARYAQHAVEGGPKLKEVLASFSLPVPLRLIGGFALSPTKWRTVKALGDVPPSMLAQAIPEKPGAQRTWLNTLSEWTDTLARRGNFDDHHLDWAAFAIGVECGGTTPSHAVMQAGTVADFLAHRRDRFNFKWTWAKALAEAEQWHDELVKLDGEKRFVAQFGMEWDQEIDYGTLPDRIEVDGAEVIALRSAAALFSEGRAMRHCVSSYTSNVINGHCRIYSVRKDGKRIATVELSRQAEGGRWHSPQIKGPCNAAPPKYAVEAAKTLVSKANA